MVTLEFLTSMHRFPSVPGTRSPSTSVLRSKVISSTYRFTETINLVYMLKIYGQKAYQKIQ